MMRRIFGVKGSADDAGLKPIKANMGKKLDMYYNTELNRWVVRGAESQAMAEMSEKSRPPPAPVTQLGPLSPLPSNAKQVPPWVKPSAPVAVDHRRIQSFQPYHPRALHQLHPAQPDEPPGNETGSIGGEKNFSSYLPQRGRLAPSPPLGAARSSSAMPMNPHMSPPAARPPPHDLPPTDVTLPSGTLEDSAVLPGPMEASQLGSHQPRTNPFRPFDGAGPRAHEHLPPTRMTQPPQMSPPPIVSSLEHVRRGSVGQDLSAPIPPPHAEISEGVVSNQQRASVDFTILPSSSVPPMNDGYPTSIAETGTTMPPMGPDMQSQMLPPSVPGEGGTATAVDLRASSVSIAPESTALPQMSDPSLPSMSVTKTPVDSRGRASLEFNNASVDEGSTQINTSPQVRSQMTFDQSFPAPPPAIPDVSRSTLPPIPGDASFKFAVNRQSRAPSNSQRSSMMEGGPVVVMRRASRSRLQHRSPPISRRGTLKSDACDLDSPGRAQPVVTFDRVAFRSKYSNTIQTLDEIFSSLLEIYAVEARKIGKTASQSLLQHFDRLRILLPGSRSATQAEKLRNLLSSIDTDTETKSSDRPVSTGETLLTKQAEFMVRDLEEGLRKQQSALEDLQQLQSRVVEVVQVDADESLSQEQQAAAEKWQQTLDTVLRDLGEIRNEIEEITCLSSSLLGQRRMAEESFQLSILQIGREVEDHFTQTLKPRVQEIIRNKLATVREEHEKALESVKQSMEAQKAEYEKALEEIRNQFEVDKIEFLNEFERKKDELSQLSDLRDELEMERTQLQEARARHQEELAISREELNRLEAYLNDQQNMLTQRLRQCEEEEQRVTQMRLATEARDAELTAERETIAKERVELAGERKFLEHEKRRIILVSKGLESRRSKLEAKQKQKKQISDTVSTGGGGRVVLGSDGSVSGDGITETC